MGYLQELVEFRCARILVTVNVFLFVLFNRSCFFLYLTENCVEFDRMGNLSLLENASSPVKEFWE